MSLIRFSEAFVKKAGDPMYKQVSQSYLSRIISYILHSDFRQATRLVPWLKDQVEQSQDDIVVDMILEEIPDGKNHDFTMENIRKWVEENIRYVGDKQSWGMGEYWQTYEETLEKSTGDCEDGAILEYILARRKGIPSERLMLFAGDVEGGGHCWLGYRPRNYPLNWAFMDWTYWTDDRSMDYRNLYYVVSNSIDGMEHQYGEKTGTDDNYKTIWFGFNEDNSHRFMIYDFTLRDD